MPQPLNSREANLFRQVIRNYEDKHYKRGLKAAEQILKKNPKHGDTMAMKALIMNSQGKTEEAFTLGKEALNVDMKSHICWHVYGLLFRTNKNFEEAIRAYKFALKLEPESHQIQRDLATLQVQMRDYQGYLQSRLAMLQAKPQIRQSWTGLAVAHHLAGNLKDAENILTTYEDTLKKSVPLRTDVEHSEAIMYKNMIIAESGDIERALEHLESAAKHNLDALVVMESRAKYLTQLGRKEEAIKAWRDLVERNSEHPEYYTRLIEALGISEDAQKKKELFSEYQERWPRCDAARRLTLDFLTGDDFREAAQSYLTLMFNKGVPSTFANLKHLYSDSSKKQALPQIAEEYLQSRKNGDQEDKERSRGVGAALYFLAQHHNYHMSRDLAKAMEYCEKAIAHDPQDVDFVMTKARIWKHHGNTDKAASVMNEARLLDTRDRYINTKCAKYQLRNNENDKALETMGMFTRPDSTAGPLSDLLDMQCIWFMTEDGEAYARRGNFGLALKRFHTVWNIFDIWQEDQFDFHSFSLRKGMIRAYVEMVRWEDQLRDHPFYTRAALDAVKLYLSMHDHPAGMHANGVNGSANGDDAAEAKKAAKKARKEAQKAEREAAEKAAKADPNKGTQKGKQQAEAEELKKKDSDPLGQQLADTKDPLGDALKFLTPMLQFTPKNSDAQVLGFDVYMRRKRYILALRCLNAALAIDPEHPRIHEQAIAFRSTMNSTLSTLSAKVQEVIKAEFSSSDAPSSDKDLQKVNADFRGRHKDSAPHALGAIRVDRFLGADKAKCEKDAAALLGAMKGLKLEEAESVGETLREWGGKELDGFKKSAREIFPDATAFA